MPKKFLIPETCPTEIRALIDKMGTQVNAFQALGVGKDKFTRIVRGINPMPAHWSPLIERLMKGDSAPTAPTALDAPNAIVNRDSAFTPWDGTKRTFTLAPRNGRKGKAMKNVPTPIADLLDKYKGNMSAAARAGNTTAATILNIIEGTSEFTDNRQRSVFAAVHGVPMPAREDGGLDRFMLGMAVVQVSSKNYERIADVAELLDGEMLFRLSTPVGWLVIYKMKANDAMKFKRIVLRDCSKIVCP